MKYFKNSQVWYLLAALIGIGGAIISAFTVQPKFKQDAIVARVNDSVITQVEYDRALEAMKSGLRRQLTGQDRERALRRLVEEELMVQRAIDLGIDKTDHMVRKALVQSLMQSVILTQSPTEPDEETLKEFYAENLAVSTDPIRLRVRGARAAAGSTESGLFQEELQKGTPFLAAVTTSNVLEITLPTGLLPAGKIADYLGGSARDVILKMEEGQIVGPVAISGYDEFYWLQKKEGGQALAFETYRADVLAAWERALSEKAVTAYLDVLWEQAEIDLMQVSQETNR